MTEAVEHYTPPEHGWTCFHCGEHFPSTFAGARAARDHFGWTPEATPACQIKAGAEGGLVQKMRRQELALARYREEDSDKDRELHAMRADHAVALRQTEEAGYERGLADGRQLYQHAPLWRALARATERLATQIRARGRNDVFDDEIAHWRDLVTQAQVLEFGRDEGDPA